MWFILFINGFVNGLWNFSGIMVIILGPVYLAEKRRENKENF